ncbi:MAG: histidine kinase [Cytophagales bacterium]|nr:histidine kinase [Cytophagales bacterium]
MPVGGGWTLFFILFTAVVLYFIGFYWQVMASYATTTLVGFTLAHLFRGYVIKRKNWSKYGIFKLVLLVGFSYILLGFTWSLIVIPISKLLFPLEIEGKPALNWFIEVILTSVNLFITILGWQLLYFVFQLFFNFRRSEVEKWKLEAAVKDAELIALKSQINPHFIFNSLNNIRSLVVENPERARDMITHLSGLLRYSVQFNNKEKVSLKYELEIVQNYLNLELIQFEDRLQYKLEIKPETLEMKIPPMASQLLVENVIKHGIANLPEGGQIKVRSYLENNTMAVEVINTGQLKEDTGGTGIGLKNASDRLKLLFGKLSDLKIENLDHQNVLAKFTIPIN